MIEPSFIRPLLNQMPKFRFGEAAGMPAIRTEGDEVSTITSYFESVLVSPAIDQDFLAHDPITSRDLVEGEALYRHHRCQLCHQLGDTGGALGPELTAVGDRL
ncbi:MAG: hypothetical protein V3S01_03610, partial [Dehalococcoidia bacterium]